MYHPRPGSTVSPYLLVLLQSYHSSICDSHIIAGAPVATVSLSEFVPVKSGTAGGLLGFSLAIDVKVSFAMERTRAYLGCVF